MELFKLYELRTVLSLETTEHSPNRVTDDMLISKFAVIQTSKQTSFEQL